MNGQLALFDAAEASRAKAEGVGRVLDSGRAWPWKLRALDVLEDLAASGEPFTADDLVAVTGLPESSTPNANNAVGAVFNAVARRGLIVKTGAYRKSRRAVGHARVVAIWVGNPDRWP